LYLFLVSQPRYKPPPQKTKNTHPDNDAAIIPDNKLPTVQPKAIIEPNPINNPPTKEFLISLVFGI
jgi:hypothetical protein